MKQLREMRKILYVGRVGIPVDAPGIRVYNIAKVLCKMGYDVDFICDREDYNYGQTHKEFDGFNYYYNKNSGVPSTYQSIRNIYELIFANKIFFRVKEYCEQNKPYAIILYNDVYSLTKRLIRYCKKNGIKLIADVTEWYEKRKSKKIVEAIVPYLVDMRIRKLDKYVHNIVSISPYLHNYYTGLGCNSIFIPPIFEVEDDIEIKKHNYYSNYVLNIVYAGSPGSKDVLIPVLDAVRMLNREKICIRLDLVGIDTLYLKEKWEDLSYEEIGIYAMGRLPHDETLRIVRNADFGIMLRLNQRYAKAGFSTKFAECMSYGVPMICNSVGGADSLIIHMHNGILVDKAEKEQLIIALKDILAMRESELIKIKKNAFLSWHYNFSGQEFHKKLRVFIEGVT